MSLMVSNTLRRLHNSTSSLPLLSKHLFSPSGSFQSPLAAVLVGLDRGCQFPTLSGWLDVNGRCLVKARPVAGAVEQGDRALRGGRGCSDEPKTPVAELEGRLACFELSHPDAGSSPMPAQPAAQAQLKLPRLLFRAQPMPVLPSTD